MANAVVPNTVPPIPFKSPLVDADGFVSQPWAKFITALFGRVGDGVTNDSGQIGTLLTNLGNSLAALQVDVSRLDQGPTL